MQVELTLERQTIRFDTDTVGIGRASSNQISLPNDARLEQLHAVLKQVNGRWIIESREGGPVRIGNGRPVQFAWLNSGDVIHLTESGPDLLFEVPQSVTGATITSEARQPDKEGRDSRPSYGGGNVAALGAMKPAEFGRPGLPSSSPVVAPGYPPPERIKAPSPPSPIPSTPTNQSQPVDSVSTFIPADQGRLQKAIPAAVAFVVILIGVSVVFIMTRSKSQAPPAEVAEQYSPAVAAPPSAGQIERAPVDPGEFLVLIGIGDLASDNRPIVLSVGWLWDERTAFVSRELGDYLSKLLLELKQRGTARQGCVIQGIALEIAEINSPSTCPEISVLRLRDRAELPCPLREQGQIVAAKEIDRRRGQGKKFLRLSYSSLPRSPEVDLAVREAGDGTGGLGFANSLCWRAYDPELPGFTERVTEDAHLEFERGHHHWKGMNVTARLERAGMIVNDNRQIVGVTLPDSSVVWTESLQRALGSP